MNLPFICPHDHNILTCGDSDLKCAECGRRYPVREGVVCTLEHLDKFYEGTYESQIHFLPASEKPWYTWPLWLINGGYIWAVRKYLPKGATVVELGCAGGVRYFGQRYYMIGCDLSFSSLKKTNFYEKRVQADAVGCIPIPDNSVDAVVSSYFWEHIPPSCKPNILKECRRVLKSSGKIVFLYDVETENPLIRRFKYSNRPLYNRLFIEGDDHLGYQSPQENLALFAAAGFQVVKHQGMEKTWLQSPSAYTKLSQFYSAGNHLLAVSMRLGKQPFIYPYTALLRIIDSVICPWLPMNWARIDLIVCQKTK